MDTKHTAVGLGCDKQWAGIYLHSLLGKSHLMTENDDNDWLDVDNLGQVRKGDVIKSIYRALTVFGIADHVDKNGNWRNQRDGLLIPVAEACFQIMQTADNVAMELLPTAGTMIAVTVDGVEQVLIWTAELNWSNADTGEAASTTTRWNSWRLLTGQVNHA